MNFFEIVGIITVVYVTTSATIAACLFTFNKDHLLDDVRKYWKAGDHVEAILIVLFVIAMWPLIMLQGD